MTRSKSVLVVKVSIVLSDSIDECAVVQWLDKYTFQRGKIWELLE